jgi:hypothetical protein
MSPEDLRPIESREEALQINLPPRPSLVRPRSPEEAQNAARYPLRGTPVQYRDPTEPVADAEWEALG